MYALILIYKGHRFDLMELLIVIVAIKPAYIII